MAAPQRVLASRDLYEALGVAPDASAAEVQKAFRALSLTLHPDKCSEPGAEQAFQRLSEAHSVLSDALRRRAYDVERSSQVPPPRLSATAVAPAAGRQAVQRPSGSVVRSQKPWQSAEEKVAQA